MNDDGDESGNGGGGGGGDATFFPYRLFIKVLNNQSQTEARH